MLFIQVLLRFQRLSLQIYRNIRLLTESYRPDMTQNQLPDLLTLLAAFLLLSCSGGDSGQAALFDSDFDYQPVPTTHQVSFDNIYQPRKMRVIGGHC